MSKSNWLRRPAARIALVIASLATIFAFLSFANYESEHGKQRQRAASYYPEQTDQEETDRCVRYEDIADRAACFAGQLDAQHEKQRAEYDLWAQQDMAEWAFAMFIATCFGVAITCAGVLFIALTLIETRRAALFAARTLREAKRATRAAVLTVNETTRLGDLQVTQARAATEAAIANTEETRRIGEIQTRAWLYVSFKKIYPMCIDEGETSVLVDILVENHGQTPATISKIKAELFYDPRWAVEDAARSGWATFDVNNPDHFQCRSDGVARITELATERLLWPENADPDYNLPGYSTADATEVVVPKDGKLGPIQIDFRFRRTLFDGYTLPGRFSLHVELPYLDIHQAERRTCIFMQVEGANSFRIPCKGHNYLK